MMIVNTKHYAIELTDSELSELDDLLKFADALNEKAAQRKDNNPEIILGMIDENLKKIGDIIAASAMHE